MCNNPICRHLRYNYTETSKCFQTMQIFENVCKWRDVDDDKWIWMPYNQYCQESRVQYRFDISVPGPESLVDKIVFDFGMLYTLRLLEHLNENLFDASLHFVKFHTNPRIRPKRRRHIRLIKGKSFWKFVFLIGKGDNFDEFISLCNLIYENWLLLVVDACTVERTQT